MLFQRAARFDPRPAKKAYGRPLPPHRCKPRPDISALSTSTGRHDGHNRHAGILPPVFLGKSFVPCLNFPFRSVCTSRNLTVSPSSGTRKTSVDWRIFEPLSPLFFFDIYSRPCLFDLPVHGRAGQRRGSLVICRPPRIYHLAGHANDPVTFLPNGVFSYLLSLFPVSECTKGYPFLLGLSLVLIGEHLE